jgi:hypothetical protein
MIALTDSPCQRPSVSVLRQSLHPSAHAMRCKRARILLSIQIAFCRSGNRFCGFSLSASLCCQQLASACAPTPPQPQPHIPCIATIPRRLHDACIMIAAQESSGFAVRPTLRVPRRLRAASRGTGRRFLALCNTKHARFWRGSRWRRMSGGEWDRWARILCANQAAFPTIFAASESCCSAAPWPCTLNRKQAVGGIAASCSLHSPTGGMGKTSL